MYNSRKLNILSTALFTGIVALTGCSSDECLDNSNSLPLAGFRSSAPVPEEITVANMRVRALDVPGDSILSAGSSPVSEIYLPFNLDADHTSYVFEFPDNSRSVCDTITFDYARQLWFASSACGAIVNFKINGIYHTSNMIDSVAAKTDVITNTPGQNLLIYFKSSDDEL